MPKAILFDLDDTLTDRAASLDRYVAQLTVDFAEELGPADAASIVEVIVEVDERGYAPRQRVFSALQLQLAWKRVPELSRLAEHWQLWFPRSTILRRGALAVLEYLRDEGIALGLVTNGRVNLQQPKIDQVGIAPFFSVIVISEQVGCHKPDPRVFQRALDSLGIVATEAWFVGDHPINDMLGAAAVGIRPIWLAGIHTWPDGATPPAQRVETLEDVILAVQEELSLGSMSVRTTVSSLMTASNLVEDVSRRLGEPQILEIFALAVGNPTPEKLAELADQYASKPYWSAFALFVAGLPIGVVGLELQPGRSGRILHISVSPAAQRSGVGRRLIESVRDREVLGELYAETHAAAVSFYRRCGFAVTSLGEVHPGIERFACRWHTDLRSPH